MRHRLIIPLLILLIFLSIFPRSVEVLNRNPIFLLDQGRDYLAVKDIVVNHKLTLIGAEVGSGFAGLQGLFHGPFYFYLLSLPFILFNGDPYGGLLLMFAFGLLTIAMGFFLGRLILGVLGGFIMAFLVALSPPIIAQSRFVWSPHPSSFFILLALYFTYLAHKKKKLHLFLASFFTGFIYNFEFAIALPLTLAFFAYAVFLLRRDFKKIIFVFFGFIASYSPLILFELRHGLQATRGIFNYFFHPATTIRIDFGAFFRNFIDTFPGQGLIPGALIIFVFLLALVFFTLRERKKEIRYFLLFLFLVVLATFIILSLIRTHIFEYYLIHLNFIYMFFFSYFFISSYAKKQIQFLTLLAIFFTIFLFFGASNSVKITKKDYFDYGGMVKIRGKIDAIDYIYKDAAGAKFGLLVFTPPIYTYPYDYLVWWHGQRKYGYSPYQEKHGRLFYLLIEKDLSQPWTYKGWLETVIKSGRVIKEVELPSGFIIQKRMGEDVTKEI